MLERKLTTRNYYRSVRYRVGRDNCTRTADPSSCNFRIKRNSALDSTFSKTNAQQLESQSLTMDMKTLMRVDYLQSFHSMMEKTPQTARLDSRPKETLFFAEESKIIIPGVEQAEKEVENSEYPFLEPIKEPLTHVQALTSNCQKQLQRQQKEIRQIRAGLQIVKEKTNKQLDGLEKYGGQQMDKIRSILRKNHIQQQERKLKNKRQIAELRKNHKDNSKRFSDLSGSSTSMQVSIFSSAPYDLKARRQEGEPASSYV